MSENLNRRSFIKTSVAASAWATLDLSIGDKQAKAQTAAKKRKAISETSTDDLLMGKMGNLKISRLIIGGNQFSGWSHSRDLKYLRELFKAYGTEEKIMQTLQVCEENGINTIITASSAYSKSTGGKGAAGYNGLHRHILK